MAVPIERRDPDLQYERVLVAQGHATVAGVDEVGRGSWAGPLVAAAVILPLASEEIVEQLAGVRDSKLLSARRREELSRTIIERSRSVGIGWCSHQVIDRIGIAAANRRALLRAVQHLTIQPDALLLDHFRLPESAVPQLALTHGDSLSLSIAAASIVAKVIRDRWITRYESRFPGYGFARHKGYGTSFHLAALQERGPCPLHRRSFRPVAAWSL